MFGTTKKKHSDDSDEDDEDEDGSDGSEEDSEEKKDGDSGEKDVVRFLKWEELWRNSKRNGVKKRKEKEREIVA